MKAGTGVECRQTNTRLHLQAWGERERERKQTDTVSARLHAGGGGPPSLLTVWRSESEGFLIWRAQRESERAREG